MSEPIKPALSAEGWERILRPKFPLGLSAAYIEREHPAPPTTAEVIRQQLLILQSDQYGHYTYPETDDYHALAALALHGQPFGFTREDVTALRNVANSLDVDDPTYEATLEVIASLTDRVSALLPPEKE